MDDVMCISGYGVKVADLTPFIDPRKILSLIHDRFGVDLAVNLDLVEDANHLWNIIDMALVEENVCFDIAVFFEELDTSGYVMESVANNKAEWFVYLPCCMPWEYGYGVPQTIMEANATIFKALSPFLKEEVAFLDVSGHCRPIQDIS